MIQISSMILYVEKYKMLTASLGYEPGSWSIEILVRWVAWAGWRTGYMSIF